MLSALSSMLDPSSAAAAARTLDLHGAAAAHRASSARGHRRTAARTTGTSAAPASQARRPERG
ncbi:hypothetical protein [uncultured Pseudokineococcus sp.]|uniref:hypothetical protein n=1 Tax=uncultured Pseudokineococcus sp. TaxID=1642928 RepID=UPI00260B4AA1|nr:hypothetical protein [uncultured Pseudokineococcus sp.]